MSGDLAVMQPPVDIAGALVAARSPISLAWDRDVHAIECPEPLQVVVERVAHRYAGQPYIVFVNGEVRLRAEWSETVVGRGDVVHLVPLLQGGEGGSDPMAAVLMIGLAIAAPVAGGLIAQGLGLGSFTVFGQAIAWKSVFGLAVMMGGGLLINSVLAPPTKPPGNSLSDALQASPTYNLQAQGNQARIGQPIPDIYGRCRVYPDLAAMPYAEYAGNEQFLYQLHCIGQGSYDVEQILVEDTPITSFAEVTTQVVAPGQSVTLFPTAVTTSVEVSGQEALNGTPLGPFVANAFSSPADAIGIDVVASRGLYYAGDDGGLIAKTITWRVEAQPLDAAGVPLGPWETLGDETLTAATATPLRRSYRYARTAGRWQVRLTRTNAKDTSTRAGHELNWVGLRAYHPGAQDYGNVTLLAVRMRATNNLSSQASRKINAWVTRMLPQWNPTTDTWSAAAATRNPAWAIANIARASYGGRRPDNRIDLDGLAALASVWAARGDTFDAVFDSETDVWEAITRAARVGRAIPVLQGDVLRVVRDEPISVPTAMFTPRNIVRGSLRLSFNLQTEDSADCVEVEYFDFALGRAATVLATPSGSSAARPAKVQLFGCSNRTQAWREGMFVAADASKRRIRVAFETELEGLIPLRGDLIGVSHDVPAWGVGGEVVAWDAGTLTATLSEPVTFGVGTHYIALRGVDGSEHGPYEVTAGATPNQVVLAVAPAITPYTGGAQERTHFAFGLSTRWRQLCRVVSVEPRGSERVLITAANEDPAVHTADASGSPPTPPSWLLPAVPDKPAIPSSVLATSFGSPESPVLDLSWAAAPGAERYVVEVSRDNVAWTRVADQSGTTLRVPVPPGLLYVRVAPVGRQQGDWVTWSGTITGTVYAPGDPPVIIGLTASSVGLAILVEWDLPTYTAGDRVEIWRHTSNDVGGAELVHVNRTSVGIWMDAVGQANVRYWYWVRLVSRLGAAGPFSASATAVTGYVATSHLDDGAVTGVKLADLSVGSAKIANLAVVSGKIGDAAVDTLQIAGQAVTIPVSAYTAGNISVGGAWIEVQSVTIESTGAPIYVHGCFAMNGPGSSSSSIGYGRIVRTGPGTATFGPWAQRAGIVDITTAQLIGAVSMGIRDTPGAGSVEYSLQAFASVVGYSAASRSLVALEAKR